MRVIPGLVFVHPSLGLGIVTSVSGTSVSVTFEEYPNKSYMISSAFIKTNYEESLVKARVKSVRELVQKGLLEDFFDSGTKSKGRMIFNEGDSIIINEESADQIKANVYGTYIYETAITYVDGVVRFSCSCPVSGLCKHEYALIEQIKSDSSSKKEVTKTTKYYADKEVEALMNHTMEIDFSSLDSLNEKLNSLLKRPDQWTKLLEYFAIHKEIGTGSQNLMHRMCFYHDRLYEILIDLLNRKQSFLDESSFLRGLQKNRRSVLDCVDSDYYGSNVLKRREIALLYHCVNGYFEEAADVATGAINTLSRFLIAYYLEEIAPHLSNNEIKNIFKTDTSTLVDVYHRSKDTDFKKRLYLIFTEEFKKYGIKRNDIKSVDLFLRMMSKKGQKMTNKEIEEIKSLAIESIENGDHFKVVTSIFEDYLQGRYAVLPIKVAKEILSRVPDNELLIELIEERSRWHD